MGHVSYTELRRQLAAYMDQVCDERAPLVVTRQNARPVVMLSLEEFESLQETLHLLRSPANAGWLLDSVRQAEAGQTVERGLIE